MWDFMVFSKNIHLIWINFILISQFLSLIFAQCAQHVLNIKLRSEKIIELCKSQTKKSLIKILFIFYLCDTSQVENQLQAAYIGRKALVPICQCPSQEMSELKNLGGGETQTTYPGCPSWT